jgi:hypothetical protein
MPMHVLMPTSVPVPPHSQRLLSVSPTYTRKHVPTPAEFRQRPDICKSPHSFANTRRRL